MSLITEAQMRGLLLVEEAGLNPEQGAFWETVRTELDVWKAPEDGDFGFGYWVVAISGQRVIWFDSVSNLFKLDVFETRGQIRRYQAPRGALPDMLRGLSEAG